MTRRMCTAGLLLVGLAAPTGAAEAKLLTRPPDPYGSPRPAPGQEHVPLRTSFYVELGLSEKGAKDAVDAESVAVEVEPDGGPPVALLRTGRRFADGADGRFLPGK